MISRVLKTETWFAIIFSPEEPITHVKKILNKEGIQKLGAQGIVEIENQLKIIFGNDARELKKQIDELK